LADAVRIHWAIQNDLHWTVDVTFDEDQSRLRAGQGAKKWPSSGISPSTWCAKPADKRFIKTLCRKASWDPQYLL
jgi:hypothetical protein